jgi:hypothetical protein
MYLQEIEHPTRQKVLKRRDDILKLVAAML